MNSNANSPVGNFCCQFNSSDIRLEGPSGAFLSSTSVPSSPLLYVSLFRKSVEPAISHSAIHLHVSEAWQINSSVWQHPATGLGVVAGTASLLLAFLGMRLRNWRNRLRDRERQVEAILWTDSLTGLANRSRLDQLGNRLLNEQPDTEISLLYISLNRFKAINDELGYGLGDELLCALGKRLQACISSHQSHQSHHTLARIGSDEFAILLSGELAVNVGQLAKRVLAVFSQPFYIQGQVVTVSGSLGIAQTNAVTQDVAEQGIWIEGSPVRATCFSQMLIQADLAMSKAKAAQSVCQQSWQRSGEAKQTYVRGQYYQSHYAVFHPFMQAEVRSRSSLQRALAQALQRQELRVHYQPIVDLRNSQPVGFEALVRWQHPQEGLLAPGDFLPLAEEMGLIVAIDRQVMQTACQQLMSWQRQLGGMRPSLSVNLSGIHLSQPDLADYVQRLLKRYPIAPQQLNLEVTESVMIADPERAIETLRQIKALGLSISLDDFGTGYSSLCYLHQLPVDVLKIDRFFVSSLGGSDCSAFCSSDRSSPNESSPNGSSQNRSSQNGSSQNRSDRAQQPLPQHKVILASIVELAAKLNMRVVAEGIERHAQLHQLKQMHCTYGQGHYFSKPVSALAAQSVLRASQRLSRQTRTATKAL